jgi:hypothetical protein
MVCKGQKKETLNEIKITVQVSMNTYKGNITCKHMISFPLEIQFMDSVLDGRLRVYNCCKTNHGTQVPYYCHQKSPESSY